MLYTQTVLIITGIKRTSKRLGWVADLCPQCRVVRPFHLFSDRLMNHVYWITTTHRCTVGHKVVCDTCRGEGKTEIARYAGVARKDYRDLHELARDTNPMLAEAMAMNLPLDQIRASLQASDPDPASGLVGTLMHHYMLKVKRQNSITLRASTVLAAMFCAVMMTIAIIFLFSFTLVGVVGALFFSAAGIFPVYRALRAQDDGTKPRSTRDAIIESAIAMDATADDVREACRRCELMDVPIEKSLGKRKLRQIRSKLEEPTVEPTR